MRFVYLHGFASSTHSAKAQAFRQALDLKGIPLEIPDLARGDFEHLTLSGQLRLIEESLDGSPCRLIGSSMGGYLASLYAASHPEVDRLVLLAPAFGFVPRWRDLQGVDVIAHWKDTGWLEVFHYGDRTTRRVHYGLLEDAAGFPDFPDFHQPALIFHGVYDSVVPLEMSRRFIALHPNARLHEMDSDHELLCGLDAITAESVQWLTF